MTSTRIDTAIIVVAAGSGTRLAAGAPKAFIGIDEHSILAHCLRGVFRADPMQVIVVAPEDLVGEALAIAHAEAGERNDLVTVVSGGANRQDSVAAGLSRVWPAVDVVLVHDAARALTPPDVIEGVAQLVRDTGHAAIPALDVIDTIKQVDGARITGVVDRSQLAAAQTPQGFRRDVLTAAYERATTEFTDDAALVADAGHDVIRMPGSELGFKITRPDDLARARDLIRRAPENSATTGRNPGNRQNLAESSGARQARVGIGTDVHAYGGEGSLWLAGLEWPGERALSGHSDGDAVAHAIVDAVLNAAGLGDIGTHFGTDRPEFAGAHAEAFLGETARILTEAGWAVGNVSVQIQAARPRFSSRRAEAEQTLAVALGGPVSVSATTTDGLGFTGRAEGVQAFAVALVIPTVRRGIADRLER